MAATSSGKPYTDLAITPHTWVRWFDHRAENDEYVWHRDRRDRRLVVLSGHGWKFQYDNEMPFCINTYNELFVEQMQYHRLIRGDTPLILLIEEPNNVQQY